MAGLRPNVFAAAAIGALLLSAPARAQDRDPFKKGSVGIELGASPMIEIWNINEEHEQVFEGTAAFWGAIRDRIAVGIEFHHAFVVQKAPGAFVQGLSP